MSTQSQGSSPRAYGATAAVGALGLFVMVNTAAILNPVLTYVAQADFPDLPFASVTYLITIMSLMVIPFSLLSGWLAGNKIGFKPLAVGALILLAIAGFLPYFNPTNFTYVLVTRALTGVACGLLVPLGNAVVLRLFKGESATRILGIGQVITSLMAIAFQAIATSVVLIDVNLVWAVHLIAIAPAALVLFFMPEPGKVSDPAQQGDAAAAGNATAKKRTPAAVWAIGLMFIVMMVMYYGVTFNVSAIIDGEGLGDASQILLVSVANTAGGLIAGFTFNKAYQAFGGRFFLFAMLVWTAGAALFGFGHSIALLAIGSFLGGAAVFYMMPGTLAWFAERFGDVHVTFASAVLQAALGVGGFCASPWMTAVASVTGSADPRLPIMIGSVVMAICTVIWVLYARSVDRKALGK